MVKGDPRLGVLPNGTFSKGARSALRLTCGSRMIVFTYVFAEDIEANTVVGPITLESEILQATGR